MSYIGPCKFFKDQSTGKTTRYIEVFTDEITLKKGDKLFLNDFNEETEYLLANNKIGPEVAEKRKERAQFTTHSVKFSARKEA